MILMSMCLPFSHSSYASKASIEARVEQNIKNKIREIIGARLEEKYYYLMVKLNDGAIKEEESTKPLPFTSLKINTKKLENLLNEDKDDKIFSLAYDIDLVFDKNVPAKKQDLIVNEIKHTLNIDDSTRKMNVSEDVILKPEITDTAAKDIEIETHKLESEKVRLEMERLQFEAKQKEAQLNEELKKQKEEASQKEIEAAKNKEKPLIETIKDFQITIFALIFGLIIIMASILSSVFRKKDMTTLSKALESIGEGIRSAAETGGNAAPEAQQIDVPDSSSTDNSEQPSSTTTVSDLPQNDERYTEFLTLVEEKISILSQEGNYAFYRHYIDIILENPDYATAILVSVSPEISKILVSNISDEHMSIIKNGLSEEGALAKAQDNRGPALQDFYGRISLDEFTNSPLLKIKDVDWFTRLTNKDMQLISLELNSEDRIKFLASFSPSRLVSILNSCENDTDKDNLIESIKEVDQVTTENIDEIFNTVKTTWDKISKNQEEEVKKLIDGPRFFASMIQELKGEARENLLQKLAHRTDLMEQIKKYYIPFDTIEKLSNDAVKSIFGKRPTSQIALIIFSASEASREAAINSMPEMLQDTIREELTTLDSDKAKEKANKISSLKLQDEICRYLLKLNKEGLLEYKEDSGNEQNDQASAPSAA